MIETHYLSFERIIFYIFFLGDYSEEGTPVPIPNTEVKLFNADDSVSKNRKSPRDFFLFSKTPSWILFFVYTIVFYKYI